MRVCTYCGYIFKDKWNGYEESYDDVTKTRQQNFKRATKGENHEKDR